MNPWDTADDLRIMELGPRAMAGDAAATDELRVIYRRGEFDPGFGRDLEALLSPPVPFPDIQEADR